MKLQTFNLPLHLKRLTFLLFLIMLLAACASPQKEPTAVPPTNTARPATSTPAPTSTSAPTSTPIPPTETATAASSAATVAPPSSGDLIFNAQISDDPETVEFSFDYASGEYNAFQVFLDTDRKRATGFAIGGIGAEMIIEADFSKPAASAYTYAGSGEDWQWTEINKQIPFEKTDSHMVWKVPHALLNFTEVDLVFQAVDKSWDSVFVTRPKSYTFTTTAASSAATAASPSSGDLIFNIQISNDAETVQFSFDYVSGQYNAFQAFIDTDRNPATGFTVGGAGAELLIEGQATDTSASANTYAGSGKDWQWTANTAQIPFENSGSHVVWKVPRALLTVNEFDVVFQIVDTDWNPAFVTAPKSYTVK